MNSLINRTVMPLINSRGITALRMVHLVYIKEFIDRISTKPYLAKDEIERLEEQFGVKPDVISWGDYFQSEIATTAKDLSDDEFMKIFETLKFDMISSYIIFQNKGTDFFEWIENSHADFEMKDADQLTDEDNEIIHLRILMNYYSELGIADRFFESELNWHSSFSEALAV
ncbi:MAG: hypothetical protein FWG49_02585 [Leptospirales bacterium]|nr:hypothetical protein [Leptospirales bacterium]